MIGISMKKNVKTQPNKIIILSIAIATVTFVIGTVFIYAPFINRNKALRSEILIERRKNILIGKIRAFGKHLKVYDKKIPEEGRGVSWLLSEVSDMAGKENIEVTSIKPGVPEDRGLYTKLYIVMDVTSTYNQFGMFISKVESCEKFLRVEQLTIKRRDMDKDFNKDTSKFKSFDIKASIVISTVIFKE